MACQRLFSPERATATTENALIANRRPRDKIGAAEFLVGASIGAVPHGDNWNAEPVSDANPAKRPYREQVPIIAIFSNLRRSDATIFKAIQATRPVAALRQIRNFPSSFDVMGIDQHGAATPSHIATRVGQPRQTSAPRAPRGSKVGASCV